MFKNRVLTTRKNRIQMVEKIKKRIEMINEHNNKVKKRIEMINEHNNKVRENNQKIKKYSYELFEKLFSIQNSLKLVFGSFSEEYPNQMMVAKYITGKEKVLEIGGNIGRNSLIISYILNKNFSNNLVTLESDREISKQLIHNKQINRLDFYIENSALSKRKLIQHGWDTIDSDVLLDGYTSVNIISLDELNDKYKIDFDTLVLDCEGAFYYILLDMPEILNNINLIIMENDYSQESHKDYVDDV